MELCPLWFLYKGMIYHFGMDGHLLTPACPVTRHSHLNSLHSPVLSAANHHQSTQYIYSSLTDTFRQIVLCRSYKTHQHFSEGWFPAANLACLWPTHLVWSPVNSAFCPWLWEFPPLLWILFCLWLLSINSHQLCCRVSFSFGFPVFLLIGDFDTVWLAVVWTPCALSPVGFLLHKLTVCLPLPGNVTFVPLTFRSLLSLEGKSDLQ